MPFYFYAWIAEILYSFGTIFGKLSSKHQIANPWLYNFIWTVLMVVFTIPIAWYFGVTWPTHWGPLWLAGLFAAISGLFYIVSLYIFDVSVLAPVYNLRIATSALLGYIVFSETLTVEQMVYAGIMFVAGMLVTIDEKTRLSSFFSKSLLIAIVTVISSSVFHITIKYALSFEGIWEVNLWSNVLALVFLLFTIPLFKRDIGQIHTRSISGITWSTVFLTLGYFAANMAYKENVAITDAITSIPLSMVFAFLLSVFAPRLLEKHPINVYLVRFGLAGVMVWAGIQLSMA